MSVKKIGIAGTSSSGKTTLCYEALYRLKRAGVLCDGVLQQDRRFSFDRALLETDPLAQWSFIANQIKTEADMAMRPGVDILVSDRTPLDLYAYHVATHGENHMLRKMVLSWCAETFTRIYLLNPVTYEKDGVRPPEEFRDKVHSIICDLVRLLPRQGLIFHEQEGNPEYSFDRKNVPNEILAIAGRMLKEDDLVIIPEILNMDVLIGGSYAFNRATKWSDLDVYVKGLAGDTIPSKLHRLQSMLGFKVDLHVVPNDIVWRYLQTQGFKYYAKRG